MNSCHAAKQSGSTSMMTLSIALFIANALVSLIGSCIHRESDSAFEADKLGFRS
jgi:hypothetical protein